jgi:hypothetical protein
MRAWRRALLGALLVGAVAAAGIALNFTLLRLTQDAHDPVGKLSPRAVFSGEVPSTTLPVSPGTTRKDDRTSGGGVRPARPGDGDNDD